MFGSIVPNAGTSTSKFKRVAGAREGAVPPVLSGKSLFLGYRRLAALPRSSLSSH